MHPFLARLGIPENHLFIEGKWVPSASKETDDVLNPMDDSVIGSVALGNAADMDRALAAAGDSWAAWAERPAAARAAILYDYAALIRRHADDLASLLTLEQGKPIAEARGEVAFAADFLIHAAESARRLQGEILPGDVPHEQIWIQRVPYGVVAAMTAWNFPVALFTRKAGPALVTGNAIVIKPHEVTPLTSLALAALSVQAGVPPGVLNVVTGRGREAGHHLVSSPRTNLVSMTGSVRAGREIYAAGSRDIKSIRLELGGKAPFIVLRDANLDRAVDAAVAAKFVNGGQVCTANDRMYIERDIHDAFMDRFLAKVRALRVGNPFQGVDIGPRVSSPEVAKLRDILAKARDQGAQTLVDMNGAAHGDPHARGNWFFPAVLAVPSNDLAIMREETFGPIVPVMKVDSFDQALYLANQCDYGLSAYLFTESNRNIMRCVAELEFGEIFVNRGAGESVHAFHAGYKLSGIGGEDGRHGIEGYLRKKTLYNHFGAPTSA
ncbi:MAG TPA: aldehyde dehydrogenase family protein [Bordetella sp.]|nr:aldehyde dehydrogenase family protein [Bordetella sp.]